MKIATRIQQVRLEHSFSPEALAARAGLSTLQVASFENGEDVPSLETLDMLAAAVGVPLQHLFFEPGESNLTPRLTPRLSLQELTDGSFAPARCESLPVRSAPIFPTALKTLLAFVTRGQRR
jgi:transcriptional regulator with XRE-family HTH domain